MHDHGKIRHRLHEAKTSAQFLNSRLMAELWCSDSYAASVTQLVDLVEQIHDIEADFDGCLVRELDPPREV